MKQTARDQLIAVYLDWLNNYVTMNYATMSAYAEQQGLTPDQAATLIDLARDVATSDHPDA